MEFDFYHSYVKTLVLFCPLACDIDFISEFKFPANFQNSHQKQCQTKLQDLCMYLCLTNFAPVDRLPNQVLVIIMLVQLYFWWFKETQFYEHCCRYYFYLKRCSMPALFTVTLNDSKITNELVKQSLRVTVYVCSAIKNDFS